MKAKRSVYDRIEVIKEFPYPMLFNTDEMLELLECDSDYFESRIKPLFPPGAVVRGKKPTPKYCRWFDFQIIDGIAGERFKHEHEKRERLISMLERRLN